MDIPNTNPPEVPFVIYNKYRISHVDGTPLKGKKYFVLRLDSPDPLESTKVAAAMAAYLNTTEVHPSQKEKMIDDPQRRRMKDTAALCKSIDAIQDFMSTLKTSVSALQCSINTLMQETVEETSTDGAMQMEV